MGELDRNTVIGFVLLGVLLIGFLTWQSKISMEQEVAARQLEDSTRQVLEERVRIDSIAAVRKAEELNKTRKDEDSNAVQNPQEEPSETAQNQSDAELLRKLRFGPFAGQSTGDEQTYTLENDLIAVRFTNKGGHVERVELKQHKDHHGENVRLLDGPDNSFAWSFYHSAELEPIRTDSLYLEPELLGNSIRFRAYAGPNSWFDQIYTLADQDYMIDYDLEFHNFDGIIPTSQPYMVLDWAARILPQEKNSKYESQNTKATVRYANGDINDQKGKGSEEFDAGVHWVNYSQQFFSSTIINESNFDSHGGLIVQESDDDTSFLKKMSSELYIDFDRNPEEQYALQLYYAPNDYRELKKMHIELESIVPLGWAIFRWCNKYIIIPLFNTLNRSISSYGLIILIMTLLIKLVLSPFTYKSYVSMAKMRVLKPEMDALKEKYGDDQQRMSQETMKLYQQTGVNPLGGCLPMLLQMPILIAMYRFFPSSIELRQQSFLWATDLSTYDSIMQLPFEIPLYGDHISLFTLLMTASSILYARMNSQMNAMGGGQMQAMQYLFPFMLLFIFNSFAAALTYYYFLSNIFTFGQQYIIKKFFINEEAMHAQIQEKRKKPKKKGRFASRLEAMAKAQQSQREQMSKNKKKRK